MLNVARGNEYGFYASLQLTQERTEYGRLKNDILRDFDNDTGG